MVYFGETVRVVTNPNSGTSQPYFRASYSPFPKSNTTDLDDAFSKVFFIYGSEIIGVVKPTDGKVYKNFENIIELYGKTQVAGRKPKQVKHRKKIM